MKMQMQNKIGFLYLNFFKTLEVRTRIVLRNNAGSLFSTPSVEQTFQGRVLE